MSYKKMQNKLIKEFKINNKVWDDYLRLIEDNKYLDSKKLTRLKINNSNYKEFVVDKNINLTITYPGYKTKRKQEKYLVYDYRVNLNGTAISHPSIILDLYNKTVQYPELAKRFKEFLIELSIHGDALDLSYFRDLENTSFKPPSVAIIDYSNKIFENMNKPYLSNGNLQWNFSLYNLKMLISWIALQEDINYPMTVGCLQGRKMPFYRYIESIYSALVKKEKYSLENVLQRALTHKQPVLWSPPIDYSKISNLKE